MDSLTSGCNDEYPAPTFIRGRLQEVTFTLGTRLAEQMVEYEDDPCGLSISLRISIHGINTSDNKPPQVRFLLPFLV